MSRTSARGEVCVDTPPLRSRSASCRDVRNSYRESPPSIAAKKGESGFSKQLIWAKAEGRSLIQCIESEDIAAEKEAGGKGNGAVSGIGKIERVWLGRREL